MEDEQSSATGKRTKKPGEWVAFITSTTPPARSVAAMRKIEQFAGTNPF
jgi:hypothetical protein